MFEYFFVNANNRNKRSLFHSFLSDDQQLCLINVDTTSKRDFRSNFECLLYFIYKYAVEVQELLRDLSTIVSYKWPEGINLRS